MKMNLTCIIVNNFENVDVCKVSLQQLTLFNSFLNYIKILNYLGMCRIHVYIVKLYLYDCVILISMIWTLHKLPSMGWQEENSCKFDCVWSDLLSLLITLQVAAGKWPWHKVISCCLPRAEAFKLTFHCLSHCDYTLCNLFIAFHGLTWGYLKFKCEWKWMYSVEYIKNLQICSLSLWIKAPFWKSQCIDKQYWASIEKYNQRSGESWIEQWTSESSF